jgi:hypothetical protein
MVKVTTIKNSEGYINCHIELKELNDFPGVRGAISSNFISEVVAVFENNFSVSVSSYPMSTRIEFLNIVDKDYEVAKAQRILQVLAEIINANLSRPYTRADEEVKESNDKQYLRSIGSYWRSSRSAADQEKVDQSYVILKGKGATLWEMEVNHFSIRDLKRGFFKENYERISSIDELLSFSKKYIPK